MRGNRGCGEIASRQAGFLVAKKVIEYFSTLLMFRSSLRKLASMTAANPVTWPLRDALRVARAVLDGELHIIAGSIELARYAYEVVPDWRVHADFAVFGALASGTDHLPFSRVRHLWSAPALSKADEEMEAITVRHRASVQHACENVIARFSSDDRAVTLYCPVGPKELELIA